jgi:hypothetical protein
VAAVAGHVRDHYHLAAKILELDQVAVDVFGLEVEEGRDMLDFLGFPRGRLIERGAGGYKTTYIQKSTTKR